jgi:segregation and condensation protein A
MLLPRPPSDTLGDEEDPRAELVRRLQEYERFKRAAIDLDELQRVERDVFPATAELVERRVVRLLPSVTMQEMLVALKDVMARAEMFAHHHVQREPLSVRQRMTDVLDALRTQAFVEFTLLFRPSEGRMGVVVTFAAILELLKEGLIEIVQSDAYGPIHLRAGAPRHITLVIDNDRDEPLNRTEP